MISTENLPAFTKKQLPPRINTIGVSLLSLGLLLIIAAFFVDRSRSAFNLLLIFMFLVSIGLGSLFLVALEYVAGAIWSTPMRRVSEFLSSILIFLPLLAIPIFFNVHQLFHWSHTDVVEADAILSGKAPYLNITFFIIRALVILGLWLLFYQFIIRNSSKQDETKSQSLTSKNIKLSAVFMPVFAITISVGAIDWMMSLDPHWYSTIFAVYYFSGTILAALASATIIIVLLRENKYLPQAIVSDHYYSLGALLFAFINFWAYIAFSQYLLIWYANLPEETTWFLSRWQGGWQYISIGLLFVHFLIPYFGLLSQSSKMNPRRLLIMSIWILFAHFYDLYWIIIPTFSKGEILFGWIEIAFIIAVVGFIMLLVRYKISKNNLLPIGDPKLKRGLEFRL